MDWSSAYRDRIPVLGRVSREIQASLEDIFSAVPRVDRISTRVKTFDSFVKKVNKLDPDRKEHKYQYPLHEIQDQIGARVVVFYKSDVRPAVERVLGEIIQVEDRKVEQPDPDRFGYEGYHLVCFIPHDIYIKYDPPIDFFELQIKTLFQHAWAEAEHDLGYKPDGTLGYEDRRRIAWAAAQAWGADLIFDELRNGR